MNDIYPWHEALWTRLLPWRLDAPHAILLHGPQGIGKRDFGLALSRFWLCESPTVSRACGQCPSCIYMSLGHHPDLFRVRPEALAIAEGLDVEDDGSALDEDGQGGGSASDGGEVQQADKRMGKAPSREIRIAQIQTLITAFSISTHRQGRRVALIYPAEAMNHVTANGLLKILEEPPGANHLLLISDAPDRLLATVRSRCQQVALAPPAQASASAWLAKQDVAAAPRWLAEAGGAPLAALRAARAEPSEHAARRLLLDGLARGAELDALPLAEQLAKADRVLVVGWLQRWMWDCLAYRLGARIRYYPDERAAIVRLAETADVLQVVRFTRRLTAERRAAEHPLNGRLFFEDLLLRYAQCVAAKRG